MVQVNKLAVVFKLSKVDRAHLVVQISGWKRHSGHKPCTTTAVEDDPKLTSSIVEKASPN